MARAGARRAAAVNLALRLLLGFSLGLDAVTTPTLTPTSAGPSAQAPGYEVKKSHLPCSQVSLIFTNPSAGSCPPTSFQCRTSGFCVPFAWRCDSDRDCADGSDEEECSIKPCAQEGRCPPPNGCLGGPGKSPHNCSPRPCPAGELRCALGGACIPRTWRCDDHADCPDSSDERGCGTTETLQGKNVTSTVAPVNLERVTYVSSTWEQNADPSGDQDVDPSENQTALEVITVAAVLSAVLAVAALLALFHLVGPFRHMRDSGPLQLSESKAFLL
ncbi:PREDICTED: CD320 antigen [Elephantulus edwardii]|uniref:CD320 antigen n=1 Tax=Elephantulus edwardii TaxID=28737 RepID=UPI0003F0DBD2|nr:PREDICTED: CD320 antigen [Elephantulus edwardii]